ncbi:recombinase family protein [Geomonas sp. Red32]|uniref:recombinase family protein n=1 Tax=Geomonas sp. Red32 TaxID=2912856 RepID=UPI00202CE7AE|nr:recombinase family protein [Geomonas sp. Red32]MCM0083275.1 recombinase family protein [Geomonas sp. Red32]
MERTATKYAHYLRVSTAKQGIDGYGIDAQRAAIAKYVPAVEFIEVESGKRKDRPELLKALAFCKKEKAVLVVAKLDRLARNVAFVSMLMESGVDFVCADFPAANRLTIHVLAAVAEHEAHMISLRTTAGLKAAKARGVVLGKAMDTEKQDKGRETQVQIADRNAEKVRTTLNGLVAANLSLRQIAAELNRMDVKTPRGKTWTAQAVKNAMARTAAA